MQLKSIRLTKSAIIISLLVVLSSCASSNRYPNQPAVAPGSKIQLNITTDVPTDSIHVYFQGGGVISKARIDTYETYCSVTMTRYQEKKASQMRLKPGEFTVQKVRLYNDFSYNPQIYANNDARFYSPSYGVSYQTQLMLKSASQPDIYSLNCINHSDNYTKLGSYPQRLDFESVMGELVELP